MNRALRCLTCGTVFAPFGGGDTNKTVAWNFSQHPCASVLANRDEAMRPEVLATRSRRVHPAGRGGAA